MPKAARGSATRWGPLFGARAAAWAETWEGPAGWGTPVHEHVLDRAEIDSRGRVLDSGCGAGRFAQMAADRGASVAAIVFHDVTAAEPLVGGRARLDLSCSILPLKDPEPPRKTPNLSPEPSLGAASIVRRVRCGCRISYHCARMASAKRRRSSFIHGSADSCGQAML